MTKATYDPKKKKKVGREEKEREMGRKGETGWERLAVNLNIDIERVNNWDAEKDIQK